MGPLARLRQPWSDRRAELTLGAASLLVCAAVVAMVVLVTVHAWPTFEHDGLSWLLPGGNVDRQLEAMVGTSIHPPASAYHVRVWPVIYGTLLTTAIAVALALPIALLSSIFIVEFAPHAAAARDDPRDPPAGLGAIGDLRAWWGFSCSCRSSATT